MENIEDFFINHRAENPAMKLANSQYYAFIMSFLSRTFMKEENRFMKDDVVQKELTGYIMRVNEDYKDRSDFKIPDKTPEELLTLWCDKDHKWIIHSTNGEYSLTTEIYRFISNANESSAGFNAFKSQSIVRQLKEECHTLALESNANKEMRVKYIDEKIKKLKEEIQRCKEEKETILKSDSLIVQTLSDSEIIERGNYIADLEKQLKEEVNKLVVEVNQNITEFYSKANEMSQKNEEKAETIVNYLKKSREIKENSYYKYIHEIEQNVTQNEKAEKENEKNIRVFKVRKENIERKLGKKIDVDIIPFFRKMCDISVTACKQMYGVNDRILNSILERDTESERYIDKLLRELTMSGKALKAANIWNGPRSTLNLAKIKFETFTVLGRPLTFNAPIKESTPRIEVKKGKSIRTPETLEVKKSIDIKQIKENIAKAVAYNGEITLGELSKMYEIKSLTEVKAYLDVMSEYPMNINQKEIEVVNYTKKERNNVKPQSLVGNIVKIRNYWR